jgi:hypothetical protein
MRQNRRNALWALGLAGAAYLWQNRERLQQRFGRGQRGPGSSPPRLLPDLRGGDAERRLEQENEWSQRPRQSFGGTEV